MPTIDRKTPIITFAFLAVLAGSIPATILAEELDEAADAVVELEEIVVTGSHIQRKNLVSASPVTSVDADELLYQGTVRVEDMVRTLPQVYSTQNTSQSNGATGTATLNLRNLGTERTLVLVNGRRMPAGSPLQGGIGADVNQIPSALVQNIEVLTGGASVTYGSDAVAGVVNFLMKKDFRGRAARLPVQPVLASQRFRANGNASSGRPATLFADGTETDGDTSSASLVVGTNFDGGRGQCDGLCHLA